MQASRRTANDFQLGSWLLPTWLGGRSSVHRLGPAVAWLPHAHLHSLSVAPAGGGLPETTRGHTGRPPHFLAWFAVFSTPSSINRSTDHSHLCATSYLSLAPLNSYPHNPSFITTSTTKMARGNQRELARAKNLKKQADQVSPPSVSSPPSHQHHTDWPVLHERLWMLVPRKAEIR